ncbi:MAG: hypothetical protein DMG05_03450 [Acidobacteria bacterium]|nr:MAG: hypothetical protein DMG05_03450 [Acidobacteriota bacterium]
MVSAVYVQWTFRTDQEATWIDNFQAHDELKSKFVVATKTAAQLTHSEMIGKFLTLRDGLIISVVLMSGSNGMPVQN